MVKVKVNWCCPCEDTPPRILNREGGWKSVGSFMPRPSYPWHGTNKRLVRPHSRCGRFKEEKHLLLLPGIKLPVLGISPSPLLRTSVHGSQVTDVEHCRQQAQPKTTPHGKFHKRIHPRWIDIAPPPALKFPSAHVSKLQSCQPLTQVTALHSPYQSDKPRRASILS